MSDCIRSTPLVLLPGTLCDGSMWRPQCEALEDLAPVLVGSMTGATSIAGLAQQLLAVLPERFALAGFSMGGIVALEMLRRAPQRIAGLALLDTNYGEDTPERAGARVLQVQAAMNGGLRALVQEQLMPNYLAEANRGDAALAQQIMDMAEAVGALAFAGQAQALGTRANSLALLAEVRSPSLVLCGEEDHLCPPQAHREMAKALPDAELCVIPDAGHMAPLEQPGQVAQALRRWLEKVLKSEK